MIIVGHLETDVLIIEVTKGRIQQQLQKSWF